MSTRIGLVLGAGGVVGQAYHAGVLAALDHDLGWDPRTADLIVGTSAGSITGTLLRLGVAPQDLAAWVIDVPLSADARPLQEAIDDGERDFPEPTWRHLLRRWRLPPPALLASIVRRPWRFRASVAAIACLPAGWVDIAERAQGLDEVLGARWPEGLWICAARRDDGHRVVFGRPGAPPATLGQAVSASCAIPGYFSPIRIGGTEYLDGGVHSATNADVLRAADLDLVVVVSPMSVAGGRSRSYDALPRWSAHRRLEREVARLRREGMDVVRIEPAGRALRVMGLNAMATDRSTRVVREAFLDAGRYANDPGVRRRLHPIHERERARSAG